MSKVPNFIIIGAMKCATSTLHEQLARQEGIFMSEPKEPNFFSDDKEYAKGIDWYQSLFEPAAPTDICGESSTHYTKLPTYPETVNRLASHLRDVKFIYVMRHPIDRLISQYIHEWSKGVIPVKMDINQAVPLFPQLTDYSLYSQQLQPYWPTFGKDKVLPVFFERLLSESQAELERIATFLGYDRQPAWHFDLDAQNVSQQRMRPDVVRDFWVEAPLLKELRRLLVPKSFRNWVRGYWTIQQKPQLSQERLHHLQSLFDEDLAQLGAWLGMDLSCATWKTTVKKAISPSFS